MERTRPYKTAINIATVILIAAAFICLWNQRERAVLSEQIADRKEGTASSEGTADGKKKPCIVVDAGHGGKDPGKVGINGALEKDINLQIAQKLKQYLEQEDVEVILTRDSDDGLYDENASNKKVQDMKRRVEMIEEIAPVATVSIHQNSYHEEYVKGAQTFYYTRGEESKELAEKIQQSLLNEADKNNTRVAKANDSYYLLKKTSSTIVIVECGFLSNSEEAAKLCTEGYQDRMAWAIMMGIMQYINEMK